MSDCRRTTRGKWIAVYSKKELKSARSRGPDAAGVRVAVVSERVGFGDMNTSVSIAQSK
jgi:hypothetical protein